MVEDEAGAVFRGVGFPCRQALYVGISADGEVGPAAAHVPGQFPVGCGRLGEHPAVEVGGIEAEVEFVPVHRALVGRGFPGEHIHVGGRLPGGGYRICGDQGLGAEHHVYGQQVLRRVIRPGLSKGRHIFVHPVPEGGLELFPGLFQGHRRAIHAALQLIEGGADHQRYIGGNVGKARLEGLLEQDFTVRGGAESPHHGRSRRAGADAGGHGPLPGGNQLCVRHFCQFFWA